MTWYTPAPWKAGFRTVTTPETEDALALNVRIVGGNPKVDRANARLISAAPDLLEAAQKALAECCDLIATPAGEALAAAVSKATGRPA